MNITFSAIGKQRPETLVILATKGPELTAFGGTLDEEADGHIRAALSAADFEGAKETSADILVPGVENVARMLVFGLGEADELAAREWEALGGAIAGKLESLKSGNAGIVVDTAAGEDASVGEAERAALIASGARLRVYKFDKYKTAKKASVNSSKKLKSLRILTGSVAAAKRRFKSLDAIASGVHLARDLVNEPANELHPIEFARRAEELTSLGLEVDILKPRDMKKLGMGALLGVAQGSVHEARLAVMKWNGGHKGDAPVAFIGKGVTFDTGGISIKPAAGMEDMKGDMGGAACVAGLMAALAGRKAKLNAIGVIGLVENMPDGNAQRPGDVVKSMSGQTIAVLNTDAEGRLVLADALWYTQNKFKPKFMINLATLTGAILVALGKEYAGLFSNNDELSERLSAAGAETGEKVWRMPLDPAYDKLIDSDIADMKNIGGRLAGSITAAQFLQRFVNEVPWVHLDVAGTAMGSPKSSINQSWASGWGVRLLNRLVEDHYER